MADLGRPPTAAEPDHPEVSIHDRGWIGASPSDVYRTVASIETYGSWWRTVTVETADSQLRLALPGVGRVNVRTGGERPNVGIVLQFSGDATGVLEWYFEPFREGSVANVFLRLAQRPRRWNRGELAYRSAVRDGLLALRTLFEGRATAGERPEAHADGR
ncbi:MAG TPA: hypothetical protein VF660_07240 [Actinomycetota bacterium]